MIDKTESDLMKLQPLLFDFDGRTTYARSCNLIFRMPRKGVARNLSYLAGMAPSVCKKPFPYCARDTHTNDLLVLWHHNVFFVLESTVWESGASADQSG